MIGCPAAEAGVHIWVSLDAQVVLQDTVVLRYTGNSLLDTGGGEGYLLVHRCG